MWTKQYGRTGKDISVVSFGGMRFPKADRQKNAEIVVHAFNKGINYFDTAPGYGESEDIFKIAFQQMPRDKFYVATKATQANGDELRRVMEKSLERMGIEKIDFFHIWCVVTLESWQSRLDGGAVAAAMKAKEEGLVEHVAVSSHLPGNELAQVLKEGYFDGVLLGYCAINFPYREEALRTAHELGLGVVTMNPLGGGLIPQNRQRFDFLRGPDDRSVVEAAIRFNVSNPSITSALVGFDSKEHVDEAVAAVENFQPYPAEHIQAIRQKVPAAFNDLCTGCGYCLPCPQGVPIPRMMDAYNHFLLDKTDQLAKEVLKRLKWHWGLVPEAAEACSLCGACLKRCTQHLAITERLKRIADLAEKKA